MSSSFGDYFRQSLHLNEPERDKSGDERGGYTGEHVPTHTRNYTDKSILSNAIEDKARKKGAPGMTTHNADVDLMHTLQKRFPEEFKKADDHMKSRNLYWEEITDMFVGYDPKFDALLQDYDDFKRKREIHPIDDCLDNAVRMSMFSARIGTGIGLAYGFGRSVHLFRTMDPRYRKMNKIGFMWIATGEIPRHIMKCGFSSIMAACGAILTEQGVYMFRTFQDERLRAGARDVDCITAAGAGYGAVGSACFGLMYWSTFTTKAVSAIFIGSTLLSTLVARGVGNHYYRPHMEARSQWYLESGGDHKPWNERAVVGVTNSRISKGRFV